MHEPFFLNVNGTEYKARYERWGYTHRFSVLIGEDTVAFEPDEEGQYRVLTDKAVGTGLLQAIAAQLQELATRS